LRIAAGCCATPQRRRTAACSGCQYLVALAVHADMTVNEQRMRSTESQQIAAGVTTHHRVPGLLHSPSVLAERQVSVLVEVWNWARRGMTSRGLP